MTAYVTATTPTGVAPGGPLLCRISGAFVDVSGSPLAGCRVQVTTLGGGASHALGLVWGGSRSYATDADGVVSFYVLQGAEITVTVPALGVAWPTQAITVPDVAEVSLAELLVPYPVEYVWKYSALEVGVGEQVLDLVTALLSDGSTLAVPSDRCVVVSDDPSVVITTRFPFLEGVGAGSTLVRLVDVQWTPASVVQDFLGRYLLVDDYPTPALPEPLPVVVS